MSRFKLFFRLVLAVFFLALAFPKFMSAPIDIYIFSTLGVEPGGRIFTAIIEILTAFLLLMPATAIYGLVLGLATVIGAIIAHLTILGVVLKNANGSINDGGTTFSIALILLALVLINIYTHSQDFSVIFNKR